MEVNLPTDLIQNSSSLATTASLSAPAMSTKSSIANEAQTVPPILDNFRNGSLYRDVYGERNRGVDSMKVWWKFLKFQTFCLYLLVLSIYIYFFVILCFLLFITCITITIIILRSLRLKEKLREI